MILSTIALAPAAFAAGVISSIAGGGAFLIFPILLMTGLDPRAANITSTIAMYPMQVSTGVAGRDAATGTRHLSFNALLLISLVGGVIGALLLIMTSPKYFAKLVPWLLLFATALFAWGSFMKKPMLEEAKKPHRDNLGKIGSAICQFIISIYGGYFGAGNGLLMLATLTQAGMTTRQAGNTKNILAAVMNTSAVGVFVLTTDIYWFRAGIIAIAATAGGLLGLQILNRFDEKWLNIIIVCIGVLLTLVMFIRAH